MDKWTQSAPVLWGPDPRCTARKSFWSVSIKPLGFRRDKDLPDIVFVAKDVWRKARVLYGPIASCCLWRSIHMEYAELIPGLGVKTPWNPIIGSVWA